MSLRQTTYDLLTQIILQGGYANLLVDRMVESQTFSPKDQALAVQMVYGTLHYYWQLEYELSLLAPGQKMTPAMKVLLIFSLYQLRYLERVPTYAIVNEMVEVAKNKLGLHPSRFVNALLHQVPNLPVERSKWPLYAQLSHPQWVLQLWQKQWGDDLMRKICETNLVPAPQAVRVNRLKTSREKLLKQAYFSAGLLAQSALRYEGSGSVAQLTEFQEGLISIQDEASQKVVEILAPQAGDHILDVCAAPGSKSMHMAELMNDQGTIIAMDIHAHRVELIKDAITRLGVSSIHPKVGDGTQLKKMYLTPIFDKILLDAPCSGLGVVRHKPDILVHVKPEQLDELVQLQAKLLDSSWDVLKSGGRLVYSTCTVNKKENERQIEQFLQRHLDAKRIFQQQIFNFEFNSDGFYIAVLEKEESA